MNEVERPAIKKSRGFWGEIKESRDVREASNRMYLPPVDRLIALVKKDRSNNESVSSSDILLLITNVNPLSRKSVKSL